MNLGRVLPRLLLERERVLVVTIPSVDERLARIEKVTKGECDDVRT